MLLFARTYFSKGRKESRLTDRQSLGMLRFPLFLATRLRILPGGYLDRADVCDDDLKAVPGVR